jgi:hypothetical protein
MSNIFKQATKLKLRFNTTKGQLSTEQLWGLPLVELDNLAVRLEDESKKTGKKSFLVSNNKEEDEKEKLMFDIAFEILTTRVKEQEEARKEREAKEFNQKILSMIANKQDEELQGKSIEELEKLLKK